MRILVITDEIYPDAIGGVGKSLYNECVALARHGNTITVFVRALNHTLPPESNVNGIRIIRFYGPQRTNPFYYLYMFAIIYQVTHWLRYYKEPYDILYLHNAIYVIPVLLTRANKKAPVICTFYSAINTYIQSNIQRGKYGNLTIFARIAAWILGKTEGWAFNRVDSVLPRSLYSLQEIRRAYPDAKILYTDNLIPLGIDTSLYFPRPKAEARTYLNLPHERPVFITVRRLEGRMGLPNLIEAVKVVSKKHPDVLLLIAGKGYMRSVLEKTIQEHNLEEQVRLLGFVSEADLPLYLAAADAFILPTESQEGFGLATIEAMATGIAVIGTPIGATPEILTNIEPKLLTRDATPNALAETISFWLDRRDELEELGQKCRQAAEQFYNADQIAERLEHLFTAMSKADRK